MTFKEKIVKLRKLRGLTQDEFASAVGVSRQAVYKWECGQSYPEVLKLIEIKNLFEISIDDLLDETYEVIVPEKKKRRRISKEVAAQIESEVNKEENVKADEVTKRGFARAAEKPAPAAEETKTEPAASKAEDIKTVEEPKVVEAPKTVEEPKAVEETKPVEEPKAAEKTEIAEEPKVEAVENTVSEEPAAEEPAPVEETVPESPVAEPAATETAPAEEEKKPAEEVAAAPEQKKEKRGFWNRLFGK